MVVGTNLGTGKYSNHSANVDCVCASLGHVVKADKTGQDGCKAGLFMNETCGQTCRECLPGKISQHPEVNADCHCTPAGYIPSADRTANKGCGPGLHSPVECSTECTVCDGGKYSSHAANVECSCASLGHVPYANKTGQKGCGAGWHMDEKCGTTCKACGAGKISENAVNTHCLCVVAGHTPCATHATPCLVHDIVSSSHA